MFAPTSAEYISWTTGSVDADAAAANDRLAHAASSVALPEHISNIELTGFRNNKDPVGRSMHGNDRQCPAALLQ
jgi:hypothetical protein